MKKKMLIIFSLLGIVLVFACIWGIMYAKGDMPAAEPTGGLRGELGIDKNINEKNIDAYLGRKDCVYYDMRMLEDSVRYEEMGGDSYLSGYIEGFRVLPYPYLAPVTGLPEELGTPYDGKTLFSLSADGSYRANYEESLEILEFFFPKDKKIVLMCGGGGYAGMTKELLTFYGWNPELIYNIGGYWYYEGTHNVHVKRTNDDGTVTYDFWKVPYHEIRFETLHEVHE